MKYIYVFDDETKNEFINNGFRMIKDSKPFIFANKQDANFSSMEGKAFCFSDVMQF